MSFPGISASIIAARAASVAAPLAAFVSNPNGVVYTLKADGSVWAGPQSAPVAIGSWLVSGNAADFQAYLAPLFYGAGGAPTGSWVNLGVTDISWTLSPLGIDMAGGGMLKFRRIADGIETPAVTVEFECQVVEEP